MALTAKEREKIIEEETLRFETRQNLHSKACAEHPRRGRWFWWLGLGLLAYCLWCFMACGSGSACRHGGWGMHGKSCNHGAMMDDEGGSKMKTAPEKSEE